ncbi:MAG: hypothetical protein CSA34_02270 [Desulfobulbus propionicus]|nr:MAG: hypothetical protein CSA34_02270 [Desulfobulbus propionicus]
MMHRFCLFSGGSLLLILFFSYACPGFSADLPDKPLLRLETGRHNVAITRIDIDREERLLVTGSLDKTVRLWALDSGSLLQTLRLPLGTSHEGKVYAVAVSPDGKTVAAAGYTGNPEQGYSIYLFASSSGRLLSRLSGLEKAITALAFSPDSRLLAAGLGGKGLRLYHKNGEYWRLAGTDRNYSNTLYWLDFAPMTTGQQSARLVTSCLDGNLRLYRAATDGLHLEKKSIAGGGKHPVGVAFSPDGSRIAVGYDDSTAVTVHHGTSLARLFAADTSGMDNGSLLSVAWSIDGRQLYGAGRYNRKGVHTICQWGKAGQAKRQELASEVYNTITGLQPLADGRLVYGSVQPAWGIVGKHGRPTVHLPVIPDFRGMGQTFRLSADGRTLGFTYGDNTQAGFSLKTLALGTELGLQPPRTSGLAVEDWKNTRHPTLDGKKLPLEKHDRSRSLAIAPEGKSFLLGTSWNLYSFAANGSPRWKRPVPSVAWAVNISADSRLAAAAFSDGIVRWYRYSDGRLLLSFFLHKNRKHWVAWTPSGYYVASPGGDELIGWHLNHGRDQGANFFPASGFRKQFYRPDVVRMVLETLDEQEALEQANTRGSQHHVDVEQLLPPVIHILSPGSDSGFSRRDMTLHYQVTTPSGEPATSIKALVDGVEVAVNQDGKKQGNGSFSLTLPERDCRVSLIAVNRHGTSTPATVQLRWEGKSPEHALSLPRLYVLAIGVSKYDDPSFNLEFPGKDARDFARIMVDQKGKIYRDVQVRLLTDAEANRDAVKEGLDWLKRKSTSQDVSILFFAGHGINDRNGNAYFLSSDAGPDPLDNRGVSYGEIKDTLTTLPGKRLAFIDTCSAGNVMAIHHGGNLDLTAISNDLAAVENRVVVFTASSGGQTTLKNRSSNNGAFTRAMREGLNGKANYDGNAVITVKELGLYISEQVKKLTQGRQIPAMILPREVPDFPLAGSKKQGDKPS